ncbi:HSP20-like chaperone [Polychaeton citri CBS 116435]|uniref:HSP20-like chaperone n=1 Tax=Polychaeton citri CBS 116435 TaxID=1314669 RepID=A0A9P4Q0X8_9PEZI|nr:HSP20-like chaperone [Polychaeton citri CBS 116435]
MEVPKNTTDSKIAGKIITPEVTWAQRSSASDAEKNHIFLTIAVPDVDPKEIKLDVQPTYLDFSGYSTTKKANYHVKLELYADIDPAKSKINHSARDVEMVLQKSKLDEAFWPRLLKDKAKVHFLKTDFDKWVDEDEQDAVPDDDDYMSRMGGMGGMGGADGGFGGIDFSKLGGGGDLGAMDAGEDDDDDDLPEDEEDMPDLEGEKKGGAAASSSTSKIEEIE